MTEAKSEFQSVVAQESRGERWGVRVAGLFIVAAVATLSVGYYRVVEQAVQECKSKGLKVSAIYPPNITGLSPNKRIAECSPPAATPVELSPR